MHPQHENNPPRKRGYVYQYQLFSNLPKMIPYLIKEKKMPNLANLKITVSYNKEQLLHDTGWLHNEVESEELLEIFEDTLLTRIRERFYHPTVTFIRANHSKIFIPDTQGYNDAPLVGLVDEFVKETWQLMIDTQ